MKRITLFFAVLSTVFHVQAQVQDSAMKQLMTVREYDRFEVEYNSIQIAQGFYQRKSMDSFNALISFWKIHCPANERLVSLVLLNSIRNREFKEGISENEFLSARVKSSYSDSDLYKSSIFAYLKEYKTASTGKLSEDQYDLWVSENYPYPKDYTDYHKFYKGYYAFLKQMARDLEGKHEYDPAEKFILRVYAHPDSVRFSEIDSSIYSGSKLYDRYQAYKRYRDRIHGFGFSWQGGVWVPKGSISILGNQPYTAFTMGGRSEHIIVDYILGLRFGASPNDYKVRKDDSLYTSDNYFSWYTGVDLGCKLFRTRKSEFDVLGGIGYEEIQTLSISPDTDADESAQSIYQSVKSFNANAGLGYRIYITDHMVKDKYKRSYFSLQVKYNYTNYNNKGGTSLAGGAFTVGLVYGGYSYKFSKFTYLEK